MTLEFLGPSSHDKCENRNRQKLLTKRWVGRRNANVASHATPKESLVMVVSMEWWHE